MSVPAERLVTALEEEIGKASKLEHELARARLVLREQVTRLRVGANPELVMATLRYSLPQATGLALVERADPVLSAHTEAVLSQYGRDVLTES